MVGYHCGQCRFVTGYERQLGHQQWKPLLAKEIHVIECEDDRKQRTRQLRLGVHQYAKPVSGAAVIRFVRCYGSKADTNNVLPKYST